MRLLPADWDRSWAEQLAVSISYSAELAKELSCAFVI